MVNDETMSDMTNMRDDIKKFILNWDKDNNSSVSPKDAVVSLKSNRGTSYSQFINVLNEIQGAYYDIYAHNVNLTNTKYRKLDPTKPEEKKLIAKAKQGIPMNISIAEPSHWISEKIDVIWKDC